MALYDAFQYTLAGDEPAVFDQFTATLDPDWIHECLLQTGKVSVRRRDMPAPLVVWLVIAMGLLRYLSIAEVVAHLGIRAPNGRKPRKRRLASSSIAEARDRLGAEPVEWIFRETAQRWGIETAEEYRWRGLSLFASDGTTLRVQDTPENRAEFGLPSSGRGQSGYPQVRVVGLMGARTHTLVGAAIGPCRGKRSGEQSLARRLWQLLPDHSLSIVDKGFIHYAQFYSLQSAGIERHWLVRAKDNIKWNVLRELGHGDYLVEVEISSRDRKLDPDLPRRLVCRAINYRVEGEPKAQCLLTSLTDSTKYPAKSVAELYHERWEIELGYDEVKTHMLEREETIRSRKANKVRQEIWGILLAYNLIRMKMMDVAAKTGLPPTRLSFTHTLRLVRVFCQVHAWAAAPMKLPQRLEELDDMLALLILPPRRAERSYPRHVKIKMSTYKRNRGRPESKPSGKKEESA